MMVGAAIDILSATAVEVDGIRNSARDIQCAAGDSIVVSDAKDRIGGQLKGDAIERDIE